jgi:hypothetical protein
LVAASTSETPAWIFAGLKLPEKATRKFALVPFLHTISSPALGLDPDRLKMADSC